MTTSPASFASDELHARVRANLTRVRARIAASAPDPTRVAVLAVTKTFGVAEITVALELGLTDVGENYVEELCDKHTAVPEATLRWHYLGVLQSNKIAKAARCADVLSGVARVKELERLARIKPGATVDVQVDFTGEGRRNGAPPSEVGALVRRARELELDVRGLMVIAPPEVAAARRAFARTVALAEEFGVRERSMGMSDDLELACEFGSTEVRVGRALFGPRLPGGHLA
jgi:pyridoxal phosphate enzyme (YggS family)